MRWWKQISVTDAQQETAGSLMPFRFTKENCPENFVTWFRENFFGDLKWRDTSWREYQLEEASINISVNIMGENLGQREMRVTHASRRNQNHNAPTTYLDFDHITREYLQENDMTDKYIVFNKDSNGYFSLTIQKDAP